MGLGMYRHSDGSRRHIGKHTVLINVKEGDELKRSFLVERVVYITRKGLRISWKGLKQPVFVSTNKRMICNINSGKVVRTNKVKSIVEGLPKLPERASEIRRRSLQSITTSKGGDSGSLR